MIEIKGPTPHNGEYSYVYFFDNQNKICDKGNATNGYIVEFDKNGKRICETKFILQNKFKLEKSQKNKI